MDISLLEKLIPLLAASRVQFFKQGDLEVSFQDGAGGMAPEGKAPVGAPSAQAPSGDAAPADLGADDLMSYDQVLFHSAVASPDDKGLPLTGDAPLSESE